MPVKRNTIQRQLVMDALQALNIHATADQVYAFIIQTHPSVSKATVYRNLTQLAEVGEIFNIGHFYGSAHYDHNQPDHDHFICEKCCRVYDVPGGINAANEKLPGMDGYIINKRHLNYFGYCPECAAKN
jgi:Fe2+ or Zn2+ uptake regulation protein